VPSRGNGRLGGDDPPRFALVALELGAATRAGGDVAPRFRPWFLRADELSGSESPGGLNLSTTLRTGQEIAGPAHGGSMTALPRLGVRRWAVSGVMATRRG